MSSTAAMQGSFSIRAAAPAAEAVPADRLYPSANASRSDPPSTAAAAAEDDATLLDTRSSPSQLASSSSSSSTATAVSDVDAGVGHPHRLTGEGAPPPQHNPASLDTSATTFSAAAAANSLLFATPKGRGGGGAHGPALVVFSGGTAFNVVAGEGVMGGG